MTVRSAVRRRAERAGPVGEKCLADLDSLVATMADRWSLTVGERPAASGRWCSGCGQGDRDAVLNPLRVAWRDTDEPAYPKADSVAEMITDLGRDLAPSYPDALRAQALSYAANRAADTSRKVVVHGDPHCGNALRGPNGVVLRQTTADRDALFLDAAMRALP